MLLDVYRELPGSAVSVYVVEGRGRPVDQRAEALELLVGHLVEGGLSRLVLDHVEEHQQKRDRRVLASALRGHDVSYCHETPHSRETMLWVPDAAAWCVGRRPWRSHLDGWVTVLRA
jgi:hypothetical protein